MKVFPLLAVRVNWLSFLILCAACTPLMTTINPSLIVVGFSASRLGVGYLASSDSASTTSRTLLAVATLDEGDLIGSEVIMDSFHDVGTRRQPLRFMQDILFPTKRQRFGKAPCCQGASLRQLLMVMNGSHEQQPTILQSRSTIRKWK